MIPDGKNGEIFVKPHTSNSIDVHTKNLPDLRISVQGKYYSIFIGKVSSSKGEGLMKIHEDGKVEVLEI